MEVLFQQFPYFTTLNRLTVRVPVQFGFGYDFGLMFPFRFSCEKVIDGIFTKKKRMK